ncbi:AmmeMemoRadiSam system protein B [Singulisphaera sp. Ch08]|uniref:AmmeMemoRadiSam system protein B n=1 Tax=Singulisphaera sp. Ch08 TaxID=3120278 RepID=A0AAU7CGC1_9BACT
MASLDRPKLRPLSARRFEHQGQTYAAIADPLGVFLEPVLIPLDGYQWVVRHFDGETPLSEIQARVLRETGQLITTAQLEELVDQLDRALVLDGPTFAAYHESYQREQVRPAALAGRSYAGTERALRSQLARYFAHADGSGLPQPEPQTVPARLRGVLSPHIDFQRGGLVYTWSYKELVERSDADTFVILGVAHQYCRNRFALTRKDFETPLGRVPTNRDYVDRIASLAGQNLFEDELSHRTEHSIEFQVVFLQYLLGGIREFSIVPILVGSFHDLMDAGTDPIESADVRRFVEALHAAEAAHGKKVAYIGGIDLCHVGPEFGDPELLDPEILAEVRSFDRAMLARAAARDAAGWFGTAAEIGNRWRVCGLAAAYTMLHAMGPARGTLLKYDQAVDDGRTCCVSFASLAFEVHEESSPLAEVQTRA